MYNCICMYIVQYVKKAYAGETVYKLQPSKMFVYLTKPTHNEGCIVYCSLFILYVLV